MRALKGIVLLVVVMFAGGAFANINFSTALADTNNVFKSVGSLQIELATGPAHVCNTTYVEYPDGDKAFISSAHCFFKNGQLLAGGPKKYFIRMGFDLRGPIQSYNVKSIQCGSKFKTSTMYEKDECLIRVKQRVTELTPIKKEFLSLNDIKSLRASGHPIYLSGFHTSRNYKDRLLGANGGNFYAANMIRTWQECQIQTNPYENTGGEFLVYHDCATLENSSGAALMVYKSEKNEFVYVGTHRGVFMSNYGKKYPFGVHISKANLKILVGN